jgi:putative tryptophan/tyrosine transport system substrate-binding protein
MKRRDFITLLGGATVAWPLAARAQQPERMRRIGVLMGTPASDQESHVRLAAFLRQLGELGWRLGQNVRIEYRWYGTATEQTLAGAKELVEWQPDVIVGHSTPSVAALLQATRTIPIVFLLVADPVGSGFVESFARPGGNVTGFTTVEFSMGGKWVELLKEIAPRVTRVLLIFNPQTAAYTPFLRLIEAAAPSLAVDPIAGPVHDAAEIKRTIDAFARESSGALIAFPDIFTASHRELIVALAAQYRLPAVYPYPYFPKSGGLLSYGVDAADQFRRAASYVDRILKGAKPADLPVQAPVKFEMVINLKTAKALGLDVPLQLQQLADEVIE